jgi:FtsZ-interacting cell division protein ZipA
MPTIPNLKLIVAGILVAIAAIAAGVIWYQHREVGSLNKQNGADKVVIADQQQAASEAHTTINNQQQSAQVTDAGNVAIQQAPVKNEQQQATVQQQTDTTISTIKQQYNTLPKTDQNAVAEDQAIAQAQIDGLWKTYCNVEPQAAQCSQ